MRGKFQYFNAKAERITDKDEIKRLNALAVPPAYTDVWICADPRGHLQATGRDARGRKQYRYHPRWREVRDTDKVLTPASVRQAHCPSCASSWKRNWPNPVLPEKKCWPRL